jgi:hypothetical protein
MDERHEIPIKEWHLANYFLASFAGTYLKPVLAR